MVRFAIKFCNWDSGYIKLRIFEVKYTGRIEDSWKEILEKAMKLNDNCDYQVISIDLLEYGLYNLK